MQKPDNSTVLIMYVVYALHFFSALNGVLSPAFIVTAFLTGWPSIIAVVLSYIFRNNAYGSYLESHFSWMISTFWYAVLWLVIAGALMLTFFGIPVAILMMIITGLWVLYRIFRGFSQLLDSRPVV